MTQGVQSSSFTNNRWTYDVFLSFRGEDTRYGFTGNLFDAMRRRGMHTFIDDQGLRRGEEISPSLFKAIKESRIAIIIFSENYASSRYCLEELVHILTYLKEEGRLVWPIFYHVDPSQVRHQKGSYGEALARHEERFKDSIEKVQNWGLALSEAANLSGWQLKKGTEYEYHFIGKITEEVSKKINRTPLHVSDYPVGLKSQVLEVNSLLEIGANITVRMVGIYETGGIGKTTIARATYNLIGDHFEDLCFLSNVREVSDKRGLLHLQETLLYELVGEKDIMLGDVNRGVSLIKHRLCQKRILLVLDDVDKLEQLEALAGGCDWFGYGSRIIITTRDKHLLARHGVERIYVVKELNDKEAAQLISWNAFKKDEVHSSYMEVLNRAVLYCSGLPLALEVIGSNFFGKSINEWNSALDEQERTPDTKVLKVLKWSYDALEEYQKEVFLDVACFFNGDKLEYVKDVLLSARGINPDYAIGVLIDKSLIKINECGGHVTMHDLIQDMGREIVRQVSVEEPGSRSRLWSCDDILHILQEDKGTDKIEALVLDLPKGKEVQWSGKAFKKMEKLRMLIIRNACFSREPKHLPNSLRVLDWRHYSWKCLPSDFHPKNLVILNLPKSGCVSLKPLTKKFESLRSMNFSGCKLLRKVPDLSQVPNLKELCLDHCPSLIEIHDSVGFLSKLRDLSAEQCTNLEAFPHGIKLPSLELLRLSGCSRLRSFPEVLERMEKTTDLLLRGTGIEMLPYSIRNLTGLEMLDLENCKRLKQLPTSVLMLPKLSILEVRLCQELRHFSKCEGQEGEGVSSLVSSEIEQIILSKCNLSDDSLSICLSYLPNLTCLDLSFSSFTILPACIKECRFLRDLSVECCKQLRQIEGMPPDLVKFNAKNCTSLTSLSSSVFNQAFHRPGRREFVLPGQNVPEWFHQYSHGESMCFWVGNEFPAIVICSVLELDANYTFNLKLSVRINGTDCMFYVGDFLSTLETHHMVLFDLQSQLQKCKLQNLLLQDQWNHVEVLHMNDSRTRLEGKVIKCNGVYVYPLKDSIENIRFPRPCERLSMNPCWQEPSDYVNWDSNSMKSASTSDTVTHQGEMSKRKLKYMKTKELWASVKDWDKFLKFW